MAKWYEPLGHFTKEFMKRSHYFTQAELASKFSYDPKTGIITRLVASYSGRGNSKIQARAGDIAGSVNASTGYVEFRINSVIVKAHLVAWILYYGYVPEHDIDHINRNKADNRIENLREITRSCNVRNRPALVNNTSGFPGVSFSVREQNWKSYITVNNERLTLGNYKNFISAVSARAYAEELLGWEECSKSSGIKEYLQTNSFWPVPEKSAVRVYQALRRI